MSVEETNHAQPPSTRAWRLVFARFINGVVDGLAGPYPIERPGSPRVDQHADSSGVDSSVPDLCAEREFRIAKSFQYKLLPANGPGQKPLVALATDDIFFDSPDVAFDIRLEDQEAESVAVEPAEVVDVVDALERKAAQLPRPSLVKRGLKRSFDFVFAALAIILTLPLYPIIMFAIWIEDGRPFFFGHTRVTSGGRRFPYLKFRTMRKDAESLKAELKQKNRAEGPQFFIEHDPRITRVGRFLRKYSLDELPVFWNVLIGHMSLVGPQPSPWTTTRYYTPAVREARLSVRPGLTGLWQVARTHGSGDFKEWIKYDLEYVESHNWWLDIKIIWQTVASIL